MKKRNKKNADPTAAGEAGPAPPFSMVDRRHLQAQIGTIGTANRMFGVAIAASPHASPARAQSLPGTGEGPGIPAALRIARSPAVASTTCRTGMSGWASKWTSGP